jgi:hypothetical protein
MGPFRQSSQTAWSPLAFPVRDYDTYWGALGGRKWAVWCRAAREEISVRSYMARQARERDPGDAWDISGRPGTDRVASSADQHLSAG